MGFNYLWKLPPTHLREVSHAKCRCILSAVASCAVMLIACLLILGMCFRPETLSLHSGLDTEVYVSGNTTFYPQDELRWPEKIRERMGIDACAVNCLAMALSHHNIQYYPEKLNELLKQSGGFTDEGLLNWDAVFSLTNKHVRVRTPLWMSHERIVKSLCDGNPVIVRIGEDRGLAHWVLIVGHIHGDYFVFDPLSNTMSKPLGDYTSRIQAVRIVERADIESERRFLVAALSAMILAATYLFLVVFGKYGTIRRLNVFVGAVCALLAFWIGARYSLFGRNAFLAMSFMTASYALRELYYPRYGRMLYCCVTLSLAFILLSALFSPCKYAIAVPAAQLGLIFPGLHPRFRGNAVSSRNYGYSIAISGLAVLVTMFVTMDMNSYLSGNSGNPFLGIPLLSKIGDIVFPNMFCCSIEYEYSRWFLCMVPASVCFNYCILRGALSGEREPISFSMRLLYLFLMIGMALSSNVSLTYFDIHL